MFNRLFDILSPFRSMRARFSLAMGVTGIIFGIVLTSLIEWRIESVLRESAEKTLNSLASDIAATLTDDLANRQKEISLVADLIGVSGIVPPEMVRSVVDGLKQRQSAYAWIGMATPQGLVSASSDGILQDKDISSRPWFTGALKGAYLGDPHEAILLAQYMTPDANGDPPRFVDVAVPVYDEDKHLKGVLGAHLYWNWVQEVVTSTLTLRANGTPIEVLITTKDGDWRLRPGTKSSYLSLQHTNSSDGDYLQAKQVMQPKPGYLSLGWTVIVREDVRYAFAPIYESRNFMLGATALIAIIFALGTWLISGVLVKPILLLADEAKRHSHMSGMLPAEALNTKRDEAGILGQVMNRLANYDLLTGLTNRRQLTNRLNQLIANRTSYQGYSAALLIDVDDFGLLNNTKGREVGDQVLIAIARRLQQMFPQPYELSRIEGDEFVLLIDSLSQAPLEAEQAATREAEKILTCFQAPFSTPLGTYSCQASVGISMISENTVEVEDALLFAEVAMREAKRMGKNKHMIFNNHMRDDLAEQVLFKEELRAAIPSQLLVLYQPQVDKSGFVIGAELLVRWKHPVHGLISPGRFIPFAEQSGLIDPIGQWVLESACRQIKLWDNDPVKSALVLAVNVSAHEFNGPDYVDNIQQILIKTGANPKRLKLELTESALCVDVDIVVKKMLELKALGISFSLDDFGTGFSSLSYLQQMPIDQLKIDQSFIRNITTKIQDNSIVKSIIALGKSLGLEVIAEGVENKEQESCLEQFGCTIFQGYLFGKPMPLEEFERFVQT